MQVAREARGWGEQAKSALAWAMAHVKFVLAGVLTMLALLWLAAHDARVKRDVELGQMQRETAAEVAALRTRADAAMKKLHVNERTVRDLEARRALLEREAAALRARLQSLRAEDRVRAEAAPAPGHNELAGQTSARPDPARKLEAIAGSAISDLKTDADASGAHVAEHAMSVPPGLDGAAPGSCREQSAVQDALIANCEERAELSRAALEAAKRSALELGEAMRAREEIAARLAVQHRAELKVARGSRLRRFGRALEYVGVGVVIGIAIAQ